MRLVVPFLALLGATPATAFFVVPRRGQSSPAKTLLSAAAAVGNAYLNTLEEQTMQAAPTPPRAVSSYMPQMRKTVAPSSQQVATITATATTISQEAADDPPTTQQKENKVLPEDMKDLMKKIKDAGTAGIVSFGLVQLGFWSVSVIIVLFGYVKMTGHLPDLSDQEEVNKLGAGTCLARF